MSEVEQLSDWRDLPLIVFVGANRYRTDDEDVLHVWVRDGRSFDVRLPLGIEGPPSE